MSLRKTSKISLKLRLLMEISTFSSRIPFDSSDSCLVSEMGLPLSIKNLLTQNPTFSKSVSYLKIVGGLSLLPDFFSSTEHVFSTN
jgi:hypothetical protein